MLVEFPDSLWFAGDTPLEAGPGAASAGNAFAVLGTLSVNGLDSAEGGATGVLSVWPGTYGSVVIRTGRRFPRCLESGPFEAVRGGGGGSDKISAGS